MKPENVDSPPAGRRVEPRVRLRSNVRRLLERDQRKRERCGKGWAQSGAFIAPQLPRPRTKIEQRARDIMRTHGHDPDRAVTIGIYDVVAMLEDALS